MEKLPLDEVTVALLVLLTVTVTPSNGFEDASVTDPVILMFCAKIEIEKVRNVVNNVNLKVEFLMLLILLLALQFTGILRVFDSNRSLTMH